VRVIRSEGVGICFRRAKKARRLRSILLDPRSRESAKSGGFWALRNVSFTIDEGDFVALIGKNGAGKSTLLRAIAGIYTPDEGRIEVKGSISPLLGLGTGFRTVLSGRDNILINGMLLGMTRSQVMERFDEIVAFAELEDFIDQPIRSYSSGMMARLGFSIAVSNDPEVLLVDEILGVGDERFREKSQERMAQHRERAKAIVMATHNIDFVAKSCNKALWVDDGGIAFYGDVEEGVRRYKEKAKHGR
jgi:ABC-type polysaccharide/polyol phosphate transport system ATPase subunit